MDPTELLRRRRLHLDRLATTGGALGERAAAVQRADWIARPKGAALRNLLAVLAERGVTIRASSFDAVAVPPDVQLDLLDLASIREHIARLVFVEIKTARQPRVRPDFAGFFFALTEGEIEAAVALADQHCVALFNALTNEMTITTVAEILRRSRSTTMQISVQL